MQPLFVPGVHEVAQLPAEQVNPLHDTAVTAQAPVWPQVPAEIAEGGVVEEQVAAEHVCPNGSTHPVPAATH
jgi:hypothetical protein